MRTFSLLLILANALFLVWSQLIDVNINPLDRAAVAHAATPPPRIVLAREVQKPADSATEETPSLPGSAEAPLAQEQPSPSADVTALDCTSVGPFANLPEAAQAQAVLAGAGLTASRQRLEQGELWIGYWVSVQNFATRTDAEAALKFLLERGITDVYLMPGSEATNTISLGVFSDYARAQRRVEEARRLDLQAQIDDRKRAGSVYWIDVDLAEPGQAIDTSIFQTDPRKIMRLELRACPRTSGNIG